MAGFIDKLRDYFTNPPRPRAAFQLSQSYLSGIHVSSKEKSLKHYFILPIERSVIQPSFDKKNVKNESYLAEKVKEGIKKLHLTQSSITCLIPETCLKMFVFSFNSLPSSQKEKEEIIRWRLKKQMPLLPDDARLSFDVMKTNREKKVLACLAKASVIKEYEDLFAREGLKVSTVGAATLSLFDLFDRQEKDNLMVINLEEDYISLTAILNSEITLYRLKPFVLESHSQLPFSQKIDNIVKEVENTVNFIEDREKKKINSFWIRLGILAPEGEILSILREKLSLPLKGIETSLASGLNFKEKQILSPLIGQILC